MNKHVNVNHFCFSDEDNSADEENDERLERRGAKVKVRDYIE